MIHARLLSGCLLFLVSASASAWEYTLIAPDKPVQNWSIRSDRLGLRDGLAGWGQFCIDNQLAAALRGDVKKGLFFRGAGALPFGDQIRSVRELLERLLLGDVGNVGEAAPSPVGV